MQKKTRQTAQQAVQQAPRRTDQPATQWATGKSLLSTLLIGSACLGIASCSNGADDQRLETATLKLGGSAEAYEVLEQLTEAYQQQNPNIEFSFFSPSQTIGGIRGVQASELDIGGLSRKLTAEETAQGLSYVPLTEVPLVVVVHESVTGVTDISADQIRAIYSGKISNWQEIGGPDADITLLDFTEDENEKQVLRETYLGKDLEITPQAIVFAEDDELIDSIAVTDYSMATVPLEEELAELPLNILSIDGIEPSPENIQAEKYAMTLPLGLVLPKLPSPEAESFSQFISSVEGQQIIEGFAEESEESGDD